MIVKHLLLALFLYSWLDHRRHAGHQAERPRPRPLRPERRTQVAPSVRVVFLSGNDAAVDNFKENDWKMRFRFSHIPTLTVEPAFFQHGGVYVKRSAKFNEKAMVKKLLNQTECGAPVSAPAGFWLWHINVDESGLCSTTDSSSCTVCSRWEVGMTSVM